MNTFITFYTTFHFKMLFPHSFFPSETHISHTKKNPQTDLKWNSIKVNTDITYRRGIDKPWPLPLKRSFPLRSSCAKAAYVQREISLNTTKDEGSELNSLCFHYVCTMSCPGSICWLRLDGEPVMK